MDEIPETIKFSDALAALQDLDTPFPPRFLRSFSDLSRKNLRELALVWVTLPEQRKVGVLEDLEDLIEKDTIVNFDDLAKAVIDDPDPRVRVLAVRLLWECEEVRIVPMLVEILRGDEDEAVRAAAASLLGKFVLLGELESIEDSVRISVVNNLIEVVSGAEYPQVKQRALESLGYTSNPLVPEMIQRAFESKDIPWVTSALCAMGRSADERWESNVESKLNSPDVEVQFEAVRAAGELELSSARDTLLALLDDEIEDNETRLAVIWSLSQIGGDDVKEKLNGLLENALDDEEIEWIEKALENLELTSAENLELLDFAPDGEKEELELEEDYYEEGDEEYEEDEEDDDDDDAEDETD